MGRRAPQTGSEMKRRKHPKKINQRLLSAVFGFRQELQAGLLVGRREEAALSEEEGEITKKGGTNL